jgi:hypothetical protein
VKSVEELKQWHRQLDSGFWPDDLPKPPMYGLLATLGARAVVAELLRVSDAGAEGSKPSKMTLFSEAIYPL